MLAFLLFGWGSPSCSWPSVAVLPILRCTGQFYEKCVLQKMTSNTGQISSAWHRERRWFAMDSGQAPRSAPNPYSSAKARTVQTSHLARAARAAVSAIVARLQVEKILYLRFLDTDSQNEKSACGGRRAAEVDARGRKDNDRRARTSRLARYANHHLPHLLLLRFRRAPSPQHSPPSRASGCLMLRGAYRRSTTNRMAWSASGGVRRLWSELK